MPANILSPVWRPGLFLFWVGLAVLLAGSWLWPVTAQFWDGIDSASFYMMNATVQNETMAVIWALTGDRFFDNIAALTVLAVHVIFVRSQGREQYLAGFAYGLFMAISLLVLIALQRELIQIYRETPSMLLTPFHSIQDYVAWSRAKEISTTSFPSDHSTVMMIVTVTWWWYGGRKLGLLGAFLTILFSLPRQAAGAHWLTDILVGAGCSTLLTVALFKATPCGHLLYKGCLRASEYAWQKWINFRSTAASK